MDARNYDRIADLLMQIRAKYSQLGVNKLSRVEELMPTLADPMDLIDILLRMNDELGELDAKGWL